MVFKCEGRQKFSKQAFMVVGTGLDYYVVHIEGIEWGPIIRNAKIGSLVKIIVCLILMYRKILQKSDG